MIAVLLVAANAARLQTIAWALLARVFAEGTVMRDELEGTV